MRRLIAPRWLGRHLLLLVTVAVCLRLGWWQWQRGSSASGTIQNLGYAVEWPVFAGVAIFLWWKAIRLETRPHGSANAADQPSLDPALPELRPLNHRSSSPAVSARAPTGAAGGPADAPEDSADEELVAYNRMLSRLAANPRR